MQPDFLKSLILYQDDAIIVINKPAGMPVHSGRGGHEHLEQYLPELCFDYPEAPVPAHRLDKDTSGCLILGRDKKALGRIGKLFMAKRIAKTYWAIVHGKVENAEGQINIPLRKRSELKNQWWMEAHPDGQQAITDYKVIGGTDDFTLLELRPLTGRTHQLRVHCKWLGHPIVGDKVYGDAENTTMHLHAREITIPVHDNPSIIVQAPPPEHMLDLLRKCGYASE